MNNKGHKIVLNEIYQNKVVWGQILNAIAMGHSDWLDIASKLYDVSDAGTAEALTLSVGEAICNSPKEVLKLLAANPTTTLLAKNKSFNLIEVCSGVDIDDERYDGLDLALAEIAKRQQALSSVSDLLYKEKRDECIHALEASKSGILRFYGKADN